ncbi:uncharacterized protein DC041_0001028 [Schistosoma bovis]|uniref:Transporter n=2 Tax=Schistosoma TaxID=6181 RepID=A0A430Q5E0_SCHBO|nr:uncharacterized protein DC041_0001028 [Schistosoma bovis]
MLRKVFYDKKSFKLMDNSCESNVPSVIHLCTGNELALNHLSSSYENSEFINESDKQKFIVDCHVNDDTSKMKFEISDLPTRSGKLNVDNDNDNDDHREEWNNQCDFFLSVLGYAVDLANVWRFPYVCFTNGGGAFLIPYFIVMICSATPMFYLELILGQKHRRGAISLWDICPMFRGVGIAQVIISYIVAFYYNTISAWSLYFLFVSITDILPWTYCDQRRGNSINCVNFTYLQNLSNFISNDENDLLQQKNYSLASIEYFEINNKNILFKVWANAAIQIFFSTGAGFGAHIAYATYNPRRYNCYRDCLITSFVNASTSLFAGVTVFAYLGYLAHLTHTTVQTVTGEDPTPLQYNYGAKHPELSTNYSERVNITLHGTSQFYVYPKWSIYLGWTMSGISISMIPLVFFIVLVKNGFRMKISEVFSMGPLDVWPVKKRNQICNRYFNRSEGNHDKKHTSKINDDKNIQSNHYESTR